MAKVLIVFYSRNGSTEKMALAIAEGAMAEGADVRLRRAADIVGPEVMAKLRAGRRIPRGCMPLMERRRSRTRSGRMRLYSALRRDSETPRRN